MTVKGILANWLKERGYDGLCNDDCGCGLVRSKKDILSYDNCFMSCEDDATNCKPAFINYVKEEECRRCQHIDNCKFKDEDVYYSPFEKSCFKKGTEVKK